MINHLLRAYFWPITLGLAAVALFTLCWAWAVNTGWTFQGWIVAMARRAG